MIKHKSHVIPTAVDAANAFAEYALWPNLRNLRVFLIEK